jgi:recombination protein RecA
MGDKNVGLHARLMSQAMRKLTGTISRTRTCCIFINQIREKIGVMFGNPETTTGGNALKFYASVRIEIRSGSVIKDGDTPIGRVAKVKVVKNKVAPPFMKAEFEIMFGEGISKAGEIIDMAVDMDIVKKSGAWFSYNGTKLGQGRDAVKKVIADNPELADELTALIVERYNASKAGKGGRMNPFLPGQDTTRENPDAEKPVDDFGGDPDLGENEDLFGDDFGIEIEE